MAKIVWRNNWLEEETANTAREGLRTLIMARKRISSQLYSEFRKQYHRASVKLEGRNESIVAVVADSEYLERDLELLGLTGVRCFRSSSVFDGTPSNWEGCALVAWHETTQPLLSRQVWDQFAQ